MCRQNFLHGHYTSNLTKRFESHQNGSYKDSYTSTRRPVKLSFYCELTNPSMAIETEKQIKKWSKVKKKALINEEYEKLPNLAKKKFK